LLALLLLLLLLRRTMLQLLLMKLTALVMCSMPVARYSSLHSTTKVEAQQQQQQQQQKDGLRRLQVDVFSSDKQHASYLMWTHYIMPAEGATWAFKLLGQVVPLQLQWQLLYLAHANLPAVHCLCTSAAAQLHTKLRARLFSCCSCS
jgi:hypothetical protein